MSTINTRSKASKLVSDPIDDHETGQTLTAETKSTSDLSELSSVIDKGPYVHFDEYLNQKSKGWSIKESLIYSFHFGKPTMASRDFIKFKADLVISELLGDPSVQFTVKKQRGATFLGTVLIF